MPAVDAPRVRRSFARLEKVLDVPNLIDIQRKSFEWLTDPESGGLRETIEQIDIVRRMIEAYPNDLELARTADDVVRIHKGGKAASKS